MIWLTMLLTAEVTKRSESSTHFSVSGKNRLTFSMHFHPPMSMRIVCVLQMNAQSVKKPWQKICLQKPCVCVKQGENLRFKDFNRGTSESLDVLVETDEKLKSVSVNQRFLIEQLISRLLLIAKEGRI